MDLKTKLIVYVNERDLRCVILYHYRYVFDYGRVITANKKAQRSRQWFAMCDII